jgi:hypothetical protein
MVSHRFPVSTSSHHGVAAACDDGDVDPSVLSELTAFAKATRAEFQP